MSKSSFVSLLVCTVVVAGVIAGFTWLVTHPDGKVDLGNHAEVQQIYSPFNTMVKEGKKGEALTKNRVILCNNNANPVTFDLVYEKWGEKDYTISITLPGNQEWKLDDFRGRDSIRITARK